MRDCNGIALVAAAALAGLLFLSVTGSAKAPQNTSWSPLTLEGSPVDAGFVEAGAIVYGTTDAGALSGGTQADCSVDAGDADLFLISFPGGPGCQQALDTSGTQEGVVALDTAPEADRAFVAVPGDASSGLEGPNLLAYEVEQGNLSQAWTRTVNGEVLDVATDTDARFVAATFQADSGNHRLRVLSGAGTSEANFRLPGQPRAVDSSDDGRYVAVGGNTTQGGSSVGWARLYDLSLPDDDNPVIDRTIPRPQAGIVASVATTGGDRFYGGLLDGTVRLFRTNENDVETALGTDQAHVAANSDGSVVFAAAGNETARLSLQDSQLQPRWRTLVNGTSQAALARPPHLFGVASTVNGLSTEGQRIWETTAGSVVATNHTGLGLAIASPAQGGQADLSTLRGLVLQRNLTLEQPTPIPVTPGGVQRVNLSFHNQGAAILEISPSSTVSDLRVHTTPSTFQVLPGQPRNVSFTIDADPDAAPGPRRLMLDLGARPGLGADVGLDLDVTARPNVTVGFAGGQVGDQDVTQGQRVTVRLALQNHGNADARVDLAVLQSVETAWAVEVSPSANVTVPGGSVTTVRIDVTVSPTAVNGTRNELIVRGSSAHGASGVQFNLTVNPFQVLRLRPATLSQQMAPGETRFYDVSLENLGSVDAQAMLRLQPLNAEGEPCVPTEWGVVLESSRVLVPARGSQPVRVQITGPAEVPVPGVENGTAGCTTDAQRPSLRVELEARSDRGARAQSLLFANVDPSLAEPVDTPRREPFPGAGALLALLGGLAVAVGRRYP